MKKRKVGDALLKRFFTMVTRSTSIPCQYERTLVISQWNFPSFYSSTPNTNFSAEKNRYMFNKLISV